METLSTNQMLVRLMDKVEEIALTQKSHTEIIRQTNAHAKETNGKIAQAQLEIAALRLQVTEEDANIRQSMAEADSKLFERVVKYGGIAILLSGFFYIKESRDVIVSLLKYLI